MSTLTSFHFQERCLLVFFIFYLMATQRQHHLTSTNIKFERYYRFTDNAWTHGHGIQITYPIIKNSPQSICLILHLFGIVHTQDLTWIKHHSLLDFCPKKNRSFINIIIHIIMYQLQRNSHTQCHTFAVNHTHTHTHTHTGLILCLI